ncbi:helix-turn-helix domain-containing protein [Egicoccus sp. AB-alg2]|uniref:helix-turn-helix domain-containing protein n=1 Tax=Egicoccus sp. AB-alg2 TaxID=3242693 RepID=UPI00359DF4A4
MSDTSTPAARLGCRLRDIRRQQGLSLADVEVRSDGVWKAVAVGAYERGQRNLTIARLAQLAHFYGVPLQDLLTPVHRPEPVEHAAGASVRRHVLDLRRLEDGEGTPAPVRATARFAADVRRRRGDHNGTLLTVRRDDLHTVAVASGHEPLQLLDSLRNHGAVLPDPAAAAEERTA